jgi:erythromycin esterase
LNNLSSANHPPAFVAGILVSGIGFDHSRYSYLLPKMAKWLLSLLIFFSISCEATAQAFSNLDFEYGVYKGQPRKWAIEGEGDSYSARLVAGQGMGDSKGLYVTLQNAQVFVYQSIPGSAVAGKAVSVKASFRSSSGDSLQAMMAFRDAAGGRPNVSDPLAKKNGEWEVVSHLALFPDDYSSDRVLIAFITAGSGRFWLDEVRITINGVPYGNEPPDFREPTRQEIQALDKRAIAVKSLEAGAPSEDMIQLKGLIGHAGIVALGENSHGSSSIFKLKLRMVKYLVETEGFSIFALESPAVEADRINEYVLYGTGTIEEVAKDLVYPSWQTQEMLDIIQWMKVYNEKAKRKVEFRGFDMQHGGAALKALNDFAAAHDPQLAANLVGLDSLYSITKKDDEQWRAIIRKADELVSYLANRTFEGVDPEHSLEIVHYMEMFKQSLPSERSRDEIMARNIDWLMKNSGENTRIIVSADNTHITKASGKMGSFLNEWYGDQYLAVGFTYGKGTYAAYGPEKSYEVHPAFPGAYEYFFSKCKYKNYAVDLRAMSDVELINEPGGFRSIGSRPQETTQFVEIDLRDHFDIITYLESSVHTEGLRK